MAIQQSKVLILTGHSGAGKDTVSDELRRVSNIVPIIPHTTRAKRVNEVEGNPYYFISKRKFYDMIDNKEFVEHQSYITKFNDVECTEYYGTAIASIPEDTTSIITIGVNAAKGLKERLGDRAIIVYLHVSDSVREERAKARGSFDQNEWNNRLSQDHERFGGEIPTGMDVVIDNMKPLHETVKEVLSYA
jgi:guanylate kinase